MFNDKVYFLIMSDCNLCNNLLGQSVVRSWFWMYKICWKKSFTLKELVRIITSSSYRTNAESLYQNIKVLKVPEIYDYAIGVFMYKLYHGLMPSIFQCMFAVNSATHDYGTRQKDHYKVPKVKLEVVKNSVRYRGVIIWNMILQNIDIATSLQSFKFHLRQGILSTLITSVSPNEMWHSSCKQISLLAKLNPSLAPLLTTWPCFLFIAQIDVIICSYIPLCVMLTSVCKLIFVILITTGINPLRFQSLHLNCGG